MQKYIDDVADKNGRPVTGATVLVLNYPAGTTATIYSDNGVTPLSNPISTDTNGSFSFYAADGRYSLQISGNGLTPRTITDILLEDPVDGGSPGAFTTLTVSTSGTVAGSAIQTLATLAASGSAANIGSTAGNVQSDLNARPTNASLSAPGTAANIGTAAGTVQTDIDARPTSSSLAASGGAALVGTIASGTGAVARTVQSKARDVVSVFDFMTTAQIADVKAGTLAQDVTTPIQNAITASRGVYFPVGNYLVTSTLTCASTPHLFGEVASYGDATSSSTITYTGTGTAVSVTGAGKIYQPVIENLSIVASGSATSSAAAIGLLLTSSNYGSFRGLVVRGFAAGTGIKATATAGNIGASNTFYSCMLWGNKTGYSFGGISASAADYASQVVGGTVIGTGAAGSVGFTVDQYAAETIAIGLDVESCDICYDLYGNGNTSGGGVKLIGTRSEFQTTAAVRVNANTNATQLVAHRFVGGSSATWLIDNGTRTFRTDIDANVRMNAASLEILNNIPVSMRDTGGTAHTVFNFASNNTVQVGSVDFSGFNGNYAVGTWNFSQPPLGPSYTVASLPAAGSNHYGRAFVSNSTVAASGNFGALVAGGGTFTVPVFSDGVNWLIG